MRYPGRRTGQVSQATNGRFGLARRAGPPPPSYSSDCPRTYRAGLLSHGTWVARRKTVDVGDFARRSHPDHVRRGGTFDDAHVDIHVSCELIWAASINMAS